MNSTVLKPLKLAIICIMVLIAGYHCTSPTPSGRDKNNREMTVSILPQKYFVQRITGNHFTVNVMIPPGQSPATYAPTPRQMQHLSRSALYFRIGHIPFETAWMKNIAANTPSLTIIDTSKGIPLIQSDPQHAHAHNHTHDHAHGHRHTGTDPHTWLSPAAAKIQARHILDAVTRLDPKNRNVYQQNHQQLVTDIDNLDVEIRTMLAPFKGRKFMVFHPSWSYFARDYGLEQLAIEVEGKSPHPADLKKAVDTARTENIRVIFVQQQFDTHAAETVAAEIGGNVITIDPLAENWLQNMKHLAQTLSDALGQPLPGEKDTQ